MWKLVLPLVLALGAVGAALVTESRHPRADFTFINRGDVTTLDLHAMSWQQDFRLARIMYEGLLRNDIFSWDYDPIPAVAAELPEVSADGRRYTFRLRESARWSNGDPVRAQDFVFSWRRAILPDTGADYGPMFRVVHGAGSFIAWRSRALRDFAARADLPASGPERLAAAEALWRETLERFDRDVGVHALDDRTLRVDLERPVPYFLDLCAFPSFFPVHPPSVERADSRDARTGRNRTDPSWTSPDRLVTNGAFRVGRWAFKRELRFERNVYYWDSARISVNSISTPTVDDPNATVLAFRTGAVDWVSDIVPPYRAEMLADKRAFYDEHRSEVDRMRAEGLDPAEIDRRLPPDRRAFAHAWPAFGTYFYNFNCLERLRDGRRNPFADARVRRAFSMAIDRDAIATKVRRSGEPGATTLVPRDAIPGYESPAGIAFDPEGARSLLAEAGYPDPGAFPEVEVLFNRDGGHDLLAQAVARTWQECLGVRISLVQKEVKAFRESVKRADYMVSRGAWFGDYGDPTTFLEINRTGDGNNDRHYSSARFDGLLDAAADEPDPARRLAILTKAERVLIEQDAPLAPVFRYNSFCLFDPHRIGGISPHPRWEQQLDRVDVVGDGRGTDAAPSLPPRPPAGGAP